VDLIQRIAPRRTTVLITGETGTGKEIVAQAIHQASPRAARPWVAVNCAAIPKDLLEAELFGTVAGAYHGQTLARIGCFEQAEGGTLFLDEISEMPVDLQAKLLRVLQERELQRVGAAETVKLDVRVLAATNIDLLSRVKQGKFREDLYYRLHVIPLHLPPLRERSEDIPELAEHFIRKISLREECSPKRLTEEALSILMRHAWPGNVRELENALELAIVLAGDRKELCAADFSLGDGAAHATIEMTDDHFVKLPETGLDFEAVIARIELDLLEQALRRTNGNKRVAADILKLKRTTLTAKLKSLGEQFPHELNSADCAL
jgi:two-component system, NtrC family, nitrogen regulation response regulator GlnG